MKKFILALFLLTLNACGGVTDVQSTTDATGTDVQSPIFVAAPSDLPEEFRAPEFSVCSQLDVDQIDAVSAAIAEWDRAIPFAGFRLTIVECEEIRPQWPQTNISGGALDGTGINVDNGSVFITDTIYLARVESMSEQCLISDYIRAIGYFVGGADRGTMLPTGDRIIAANNSCRTQLTRADIEWLADRLRGGTGL